MITFIHKHNQKNLLVPLYFNFNEQKEIARLYFISVSMLMKSNVIVSCVCLLHRNVCPWCLRNRQWSAKLTIVIILLNQACFDTYCPHSYRVYFFSQQIAILSCSLYSLLVKFGSLWGLTMESKPKAYRKLIHHTQKSFFFFSHIIKNEDQHLASICLCLDFP